MEIFSAAAAWAGTEPIISRGYSSKSADMAVIRLMPVSEAQMAKSWCRQFTTFTCDPWTLKSLLEY